MHEEEIQQLFNSPAGYLGPLKIEWAKDEKDASKPLLLVDEALRGRKNLIGGANNHDYHFRNVTPRRDFHADGVRRRAQRGRRRGLPQLRPRR